MTATSCTPLYLSADVPQLRAVRLIYRPSQTYCIGGLEYKGLMTRLTCDKTLSFSSGLLQTMENVPALSP